MLRIYFDFFLMPEVNFNKTEAKRNISDFNLTNSLPYFLSSYLKCNLWNTLLVHISCSSQLNQAHSPKGCAALWASSACSNCSRRRSNEPENRINYLSNRAKLERTLTVRVCQTICSCISKHKWNVNVNNTQKNEFLIKKKQLSEDGAVCVRERAIAECAVLVSCIHQGARAAQAAGEEEEQRLFPLLLLLLLLHCKCINKVWYYSTASCAHWMQQLAPLPPLPRLFLPPFPPLWPLNDVTRKMVEDTTHVDNVNIASESESESVPEPATSDMWQATGIDRPRASRRGATLQGICSSSDCQQQAESRASPAALNIQNIVNVECVEREL